MNGLFTRLFGAQILIVSNSFLPSQLRFNIRSIAFQFLQALSLEHDRGTDLFILMLARNSHLEIPGIQNPPWKQYSEISFFYFLMTKCEWFQNESDILLIFNSHLMVHFECQIFLNENIHWVIMIFFMSTQVPVDHKM